VPAISVRSFAPLMRQRVTVNPIVASSSGYDDYGNASYGASVVYQCAVVMEMKLVTDAQGQQVPSGTQVYLASAAAVRPEDRITLSTADVGSTESYAINPRIISVQRYPFTRGQFVTCIYSK